MKVLLVGIAGRFGINNMWVAFSAMNGVELPGKQRSRLRVGARLRK